MIEGDASADRHVYSVLEFTERLRHHFASNRTLSNIAISGEISDLRTFGGGHLGFRLKEKQAVIECIAWSDHRRTLAQVENGTSVIATGAIGVRPERGCYQLVVAHLEPTGRGALFMEYQRLLEKFRAEGLFEASRKRRVPGLPRRVALISARGKGMEDFVGTLARKAPFVEVIFVETQVQGQGAEIEIAGALDKACELDVDAIAIVRGGGSYEDLFPFNLEPVVRAIVRSRHPVLTAIGHEGHHHLADQVADRSFISPTAAAEHIAQGWEFARRQLRELDGRLGRAARGVLVQASHRADEARHTLNRAAERAVEQSRRRLEALLLALTRRSPREVVGNDRARLAQVRSALALGLERFLNRARRGLERVDARLETFDVSAMLARGYAVVTHNGAVVRDASVLRTGDSLDARFERGSATAIVERIGSDA
ncbi:MAG: exodeoxyribonuclease VII large subunit [Candidatus Tyrphobacter sp.]